VPLWKYYDEEVDPTHPRQTKGPWQIGATRVWQNRVYVWGTHLITLDISDPRRPKVISNRPNPQFYGDTGGFRSMRQNGELREIALPQIPELPAIERLRMVASTGWGAFDGKIFCGDDWTKLPVSLYSFRLVGLTDQAASFEPVSQYQQSMLEQVFGFQDFGGLKLENGLLFNSAVPSGPVQYYGSINGSITVFDVRGSGVFREVGHFAAPGVRNVWPLPDGRCIVGGSKLWLVGPPPRMAD